MEAFAEDGQHIAGLHYAFEEVTDGELGIVGQVSGVQAGGKFAFAFEVLNRFALQAVRQLGEGIAQRSRFYSSSRTSFGSGGRLARYARRFARSSSVFRRRSSCCLGVRLPFRSWKYCFGSKVKLSMVFLPYGPFCIFQQVHLDRLGVTAEQSALVGIAGRIDAIRIRREQRPDLLGTALIRIEETDKAVRYWRLAEH